MLSYGLPFTEIAGYRLTEQIGAGGMGSVYKAYHLKSNHQAAVKILHQKEWEPRFQNEANIQSSLYHPNIARLYRLDYLEGAPCIIMEYVEGMSLDAYLSRKGKLFSEEAEAILLQISSALAYLHQNGIIHRDIKPSNFKIQPGGTIKMLDFGIAKNKNTPQFTRQGFVIGTMEYMAPEQFLNQVSIQSDIWSLGVMAYEMVSGNLPFEAANPVALSDKILHARFTNPGILVPQLSERIGAVINNSLRKRPASRISAKGIEALLSSTSAPRSTALHVGKVRLKSVPARYLYGAGTFLVIVVALFLLINGSSNKEPHALTDFQPIQTNISVTGAKDAFIILSDGTRIPVSKGIQGIDGAIVDFTLQAEGYVDRQVHIVVSPRRKAYSYRLERIKK